MCIRYTKYIKHHNLVFDSSVLSRNRGSDFQQSQLSRNAVEGEKIYSPNRKISLSIYLPEATSLTVAFPSTQLSSFLVTIFELSSGHTVRFRVTKQCDRIIESQFDLGCEGP